MLAFAAVEGRAVAVRTKCRWERQPARSVALQDGLSQMGLCQGHISDPTLSNGIYLASLFILWKHTIWRMISFIWHARKGKTNLEWQKAENVCLRPILVCVWGGRKGTCGNLRGDGNVLYFYCDTVYILLWVYTFLKFTKLCTQKGYIWLIVYKYISIMSIFKKCDIQEVLWWGGQWLV